MTRFIVQTVSGYPIRVPIPSHTNARHGLSAHVCDATYLHAVVATYRSTDAAPTPDNHAARLGVEGARAAAEAHAARLNDGS